MKFLPSILATLLVGMSPGFAQGFVNLDFESAIIKVDPSGGYSWSVYANRAIPGWTAYIGGTPINDIWYNDVPLGAPEVTLQGTNNILGRPVIQGNYFVMLWGAFNYPTNGDGTVAIGQTGQIPVSAQSLVFWGYVGGLQVTFNGQPLNFLGIGSTNNYTIYAANISAYAGQTGKLLFSDPYYTGTQGGPASIDNIQFSSSIVPEPSELALAAVGTWLLASRRWKS